VAVGTVRGSACLRRWIGEVLRRRIEVAGNAGKEWHRYERKELAGRYP
jgi:hypothetical protein